MIKKAIIHKSQKDLYYVLVGDKSYQSKARGVFRDRNIKPLVGDYVDITILNDKEAIIDKVYPRVSQLVRPPVANIDQILLVLTLKNPNLNYSLVDKYLVMLEHFNLDVVIVFNKIDLISSEQVEELKLIYANTSYKLIFSSVILKIGLEELKESMAGKISALAGPSGVGKSSLLNSISSEATNVETGTISRKTSRGKHTTRHTELFQIFKDTYILDTPGFSSLDLSFIEDEYQIRDFYPEFRKYQNNCKFQNCQHIKEPFCSVKEALEKGQINEKRYENYLLIREEIKNTRRY